MEINHEKATILANDIQKALDDKKGIDISIISVGRQTVLADYFVLANGTSSTHIIALTDEVEKQLNDKHGLLPSRVEGISGRNWVLMDYGSVVVHIFTKEARDFYKLDRLWAESGISHIKTNEQEA